MKKRFFKLAGFSFILLLLVILSRSNKKKKTPTKPRKTDDLQPPIRVDVPYVFDEEGIPIKPPNTNPEHSDDDNLPQML